MDLYFRTSLFLWFKRASRFAKKKKPDYHKSIKKNSKTRGTKGGGPENNIETIRLIKKNDERKQKP